MIKRAKNLKKANWRKNRKKPNAITADLFNEIKPLDIGLFERKNND